jgi:hypothetical protein
LLGPGYAVGVLPLLCTGFLLSAKPVARALAGHWQRIACACVAVAAMIAIARIPSAVAALVCAMALVAITPLVLETALRLGSETTTACCCAAAAFAAIHGASGLGEVSADPVGRASIGLLGVGLIGLWARRPGPAHIRPAANGGNAASAVAFALVELELLASPATLTGLETSASPRLDIGPSPFMPWLLAIFGASLSGLAIGLRVTQTRMRLPTVSIAAALYVAGLVGLLHGPLWLLKPLWLIVTQCAAVWLLQAASAAPTQGTSESLARRLGVVQALWLASVALIAASRDWPFFPLTLRSYLEGMTPAYFMASLMVLPLSAWYSARRRR